MAKRKTLKPEMTVAEEICRREFMSAARDGDVRRCHDALVELYRDPARWFCSAIDNRGIARSYGKGDTEKEARQNADIAARECVDVAARGYLNGKRSSCSLEMLNWRFIAFPPMPWPDNREGEDCSPPTPNSDAQVS